jgi:hypothetical protein
MLLVLIKGVGEELNKNKNKTSFKTTYGTPLASPLEKGRNPLLFKEGRRGGCG